MSEWSWSNVRKNIHWDDFTAGAAIASVLWIILLLCLLEIPA
jgi:hypothetical protein